MTAISDQSLRAAGTISVARRRSVPGSARSWRKHEPHRVDAEPVAELDARAELLPGEPDPGNVNADLSARFDHPCAFAKLMPDAVDLDVKHWNWRFVRHK